MINDVVRNNGSEHAGEIKSTGVPMLRRQQHLVGAFKGMRSNTSPASDSELAKKDHVCAKLKTSILYEGEYYERILRVACPPVAQW